MKQTLPSYIKRCATCEYWSGEREAVDSGLAVAVENLTDAKNTAKCRNPNAQTYACGHPSANSGCGVHYKKWFELR